MNPEQQYGPPQSQYDFIVNPGGQPKKSLLPSLGGQSSFTQKLILIIGGAVILIVLMWIVGNIIGGGGSSTTNITKLIQQEEEIARVSAQGTESGATSLRNAAITTQLSLTSHQQQWLQFLADQGTKVGEEQQKQLENAATDQQLENAKANNTFDKALADILRSYLNEYATTIQTTFDTTSNEAERELLRAHFQQAQLLLEQLPKS